MLKRNAIPAAAIAGLCVAWLVLTATLDMPKAFVPSPLDVGRALITLLRGGFLFDITASFGRILAAFIVSAIAALPLGLLMGSNRSVNAALQPPVDFLRYVPIPALLPLFILWTGIGEAPKFLVLFAGTFFQLLVLVRDSVRSVPQRFYDAAQTLGANQTRLLTGVTIPYLAPILYDHLRVTLGWCWTYLVIAELVNVERGVGFVIKEAQRFGTADRLFVCFITLGCIGLLTDTLLIRLRPVVFPYLRQPD